MPATTTTRPTLTRGPLGWRVSTPSDAVLDWIDVATFDDAKKALKMLTTGATVDDVVFDLTSAEYDEPTGCECEVDWNCPLHAHRAGTWLETRYDGLDDGERF